MSVSFWNEDLNKRIQKWLVSNIFTLVSCGNRDELVLEQNSFRYHVDFMNKAPKSFYSQSITLCSPARTL